MQSAGTNHNDGDGGTVRTTMRPSGHCHETKCSSYRNFGTPVLAGSILNDTGGGTSRTLLRPSGRWHNKHIVCTNYIFDQIPEDNSNHHAIKHTIRA